MRYILATTLLMTVGMTSPASAECGPAVQNWQNGSQTTCPYDSNGGAVEPAGAAPAAAPPQMEEENCRGYEGRKSYGGLKGFKGFKGYGGGES